MTSAARGLLAASLVLCLTGCGATPSTQARGRPLGDWLQALESTDVGERKTAVEVLGNVGANDAAALPALARTLKDADPRIRDAEVLAIMKSGPAAAATLPALQSALEDSDPTVRSHAALAVKRVRGRR